MKSRQWYLLWAVVLVVLVGLLAWCHSIASGVRKIEALLQHWAEEDGWEYNLIRVEAPRTPWSDPSERWLEAVRTTPEGMELRGIYWHGEEETWVYGTRVDQP